jgi:hypothetical protein
MKLHSKRVEKIQKYTRFECIFKALSVHAFLHPGPAQTFTKVDREPNVQLVTDGLSGTGEIHSFRV